MNTPLRVTVLTPLGEGGQGGIDRLMDSLRPELGAQAGGPVVADFVATRGASLWVMPLAFAMVLLKLSSSVRGLKVAEVAPIVPAPEPPAAVLVQL